MYSLLIGISCSTIIYNDIFINIYYFVLSTNFIIITNVLLLLLYLIIICSLLT